MALGQGIDAVTGHKVTADDELAKKGAGEPGPGEDDDDAAAHARRRPVGHPRPALPGQHDRAAPRFDPEDVWRLVEEEGVNAVMIAGDAMGRPMIEALEANPDRWDTSSLFAISSSAALFSVPVKERFFEAVPAPRSSPTRSARPRAGSTASPRSARATPSGGSTGGLPRVAPMADVIVVDDDMQPLTPGDGQVGKVARGGNIPLGYYKDPEKTARTFLTGPDGRRYVVAGDFARWEEDGSITLLGRGSVCINTGGEKVFPEEVEGALKSHPDVFDALVVGVPDERWGSAVAAVVQPTRGLDADARVARRARPHEGRRLQGAEAPRARRRDRALAGGQARLPVGHEARRRAARRVVVRRRTSCSSSATRSGRAGGCRRTCRCRGASGSWPRAPSSTSHWTHSAPCSPSRATVMTGTHLGPARRRRQHDLPVAHVARPGHADDRLGAAGRGLPVELPRQVALHVRAAPRHGGLRLRRLGRQRPALHGLGRHRRALRPDHRRLGGTVAGGERGGGRRSRGSSRSRS